MTNVKTSNVKLDFDQIPGNFSFSAYGPGEFVVNETRIHSSLIISPRTLIDDWSARTIAQITDDDIQRIRALEPEVVIFGTGTRLQFLPQTMQRELLERGVGVECMDSAAACRCYTVLAAEGRAVVAAILLY